MKEDDGKYSFSEEHRRRLSEAHKEKKFSKEHRRNISENHSRYWKGKHRSEETRRKMSQAHRGRKLSQEHRRRISESKRGENNPRWKGGKTPYYGDDWYQQRRLVRERGNYTCLCGARENGREHDVHHIVPYRISRDNSQDNLWILCPKCHRKIEAIIGAQTTE